MIRMTATEQVPVVEVSPSSVADTRTCDYTNVSREMLLAASEQHIGDVQRVLAAMSTYLIMAAATHDADKVSDVDGFHRDFVTGFAQTDWWNNHRRIWRHHLAQADGVPDDVNLLDVVEYIVDCVCAGVTRSGSVHPLVMSDALLRRAFDNTVTLLSEKVQLTGKVRG